MCLNVDHNYYSFKIVDQKRYFSSRSPLRPYKFGLKFFLFQTVCSTVTVEHSFESQT